MLAIAFAATSNQTAMEDHLLKGLELDPGSGLAEGALERAATSMSDPADRHALLEKVRAVAPKLAISDLMLARNALAEGNYPQGIAKLQALRQSRPDDRPLLIELLTAQVRHGDLAPATKTATAWIDAHPDDAHVQRLLAQIYQRREQADKAIATYETVLRNAPNDLVALNNLAMLLADQDPTRALGLAQSAYLGAPENVAIADTFGRLLLATSQPTRAAEVLGHAHGQAPGEASLAYHYARALASSGDKDRARQVLLLVLDKSFPEKADAQALLKDLPQ
jgi:Flp pilus assembly protein TadD